MTADSGASSHFIRNYLLPCIQPKINHNVQLEPPVAINVAGRCRLSCVGQGVLIVQVLDHIGSKHAVQLPVTIVLGPSSHPFSGGSAVTRGANVIIATNLCLGMGAFTVPLRNHSHCSTLHHLDLTTGAIGRTHETTFPTISGSNF